MAVVARTVDDSVYDYHIADYPEDDAAGKPMRVSPTHLLTTRTNLVN